MTAKHVCDSNVERNIKASKTGALFAAIRFKPSASPPGILNILL